MCTQAYTHKQIHTHTTITVGEFVLDTNWNHLG